MTIYAPTKNPGDTRTRCRYVGIRNVLNAAPNIEVLEQEVVRLVDGEAVLRDLDGVNAAITGAAFALLDPRTDEPIDGQVKAAIAGALESGFADDETTMMLVYSWVRYQQAQRDAREAAQEEIMQ